MLKESNCPVVEKIWSCPISQYLNLYFMFGEHHVFVYYFKKYVNKDLYILLPYLDKLLIRPNSV